MKLLKKAEVKKVGSWSEMTYDAETYVIRWLRVKDGMGGRGDREDWVADIPGMTICVHDYNWKEMSFGVRFGKTRDEAMVAALKRHVCNARHDIIEARTKLVVMETGLNMLEAAIKGQTHRE
jgi:hypothetical protein